MSNPRKVLAIGTRDGANRDFQTPTQYFSGTVVPFINGIAAHNQATVELGGKDFRLEFPPKATDEVAVYYRTI